jgi:hypothetical protein
MEALASLMFSDSPHRSSHPGRSQDSMFAAAGDQNFTSRAGAPRIGFVSDGEYE